MPERGLKSLKLKKPLLQLHWEHLVVYSLMSHEQKDPHPLEFSFLDIFTK